MQDGIIKGTGNSRYLKSISNFLTQYPTYQDFVAALVAGTLPIDLNGINETGWDQLGTALNKANLLSDETAAALDLESDAVPDDALKKIKNIEFGSYVGTGKHGEKNPNVLTFGFKPQLVIIPSTYMAIMMRAYDRHAAKGSGSSPTLWLTWGENSLSWYVRSAANAEQQQNTSGAKYFYMAMG